MQVYTFLSKFSFLSKYAYKIIFIAVLCIAMPLIGVSLYFYINQGQIIEIRDVMYLISVLTLFAVVAAIKLIIDITEPIKQASEELDYYMQYNKDPQLPTHYTDEVGVLLKQIKESATSTKVMVGEINDITAMLSHDLRSPVVSIMGLVRLVKDSLDDPQEKFYCTKIEELSHHQLNLMESILSLLNEDNPSKANPKKIKINLSSALAQSLNQFELTLQNKQLEIIKDIPEGLEVKVEPFSFSQVLSNLIHNAIKFSRKGEKINIRAHNGGDSVKIMVKDQGIGFDLSNSNVLFDRFTDERKRGTQGEATNGLGLYLTKKIVEKHDGSITATSDGNNKGATFEVVLPAV